MGIVWDAHVAIPQEAITGHQTGNENPLDLAQCSERFLSKDQASRRKQGLHEGSDEHRHGALVGDCVFGGDGGGEMLFRRFYCVGFEE